MNLDVLEKGGISIGICLMVLILADTFMTKPIQLEDTILIEGNFNRIEKIQLKGKVSKSYNIYIEEETKFYKILPDWIECFNLESFKNEVEVGQPIQIYIRKENGIRSSELPVAVSLVVNEKDYLNQFCINEEIENNKTQIPLLALFSISLFGAVIYFRNRLFKRT